MTFVIQQTLLYAVPLMIVALAGVFAERSGIINLALEGIMIFGAFIGVLFVRSVQSMPLFLNAFRAGDWMTLQGLEILAMVLLPPSWVWISSSPVLRSMPVSWWQSSLPLPCIF